MTKYDVRPAILEDVPYLIAVVEDTGLFPSEFLAPMMAEVLGGTKPGLWLSGCTDGRPVGLCFAEPKEMADGTWNMRALAVRSDCQRSGLGRALVLSAEAHLRDAGHRILLVDTSSTEGFADARRFYAQMGYGEEARIRDYWAPGDHKVTFRKAL